MKESALSSSKLVINVVFLSISIQCKAQTKTLAMLFSLPMTLEMCNLVGKERERVAYRVCTALVPVIELVKRTMNLVR